MVDKQITKNFCGIAADKHPEMWVDGKLVAEGKAKLDVDPNSGVNAVVPATLYRGGDGIGGTITVNTTDNTCAADMKGGALWGGTKQVTPFVGPIPKPSGP